MFIYCRQGRPVIEELEELPPPFRPFREEKFKNQGKIEEKKGANRKNRRFAPKLPLIYPYFALIWPKLNFFKVPDPQIWHF